MNSLRPREVKCNDLLVDHVVVEKGVCSLGNWTDLDPNPDFANYQLCDFGPTINVLSLYFFLIKMVTVRTYFIQFVEKIKWLSVCKMPSSAWSGIGASQVLNLCPFLYLKSEGKKRMCVHMCCGGCWRPVIKSVLWGRGNVTNSSQQRAHHHQARHQPHDLYLSSRTVSGSCSLLHRGGLWTNCWFGRRVSW